MSMEALEKIVAAENGCQDRVAAASVEARQILAEAERAGQDALVQAREEGAQQSKKLLLQAEERAEKQAQKILQAADAEAAALRKGAAERLGKAATFIVGKVVVEWPS